ncbi:DNA-binding protein [Bifidobacterium vansinderenii]|uniref:DNA-binding protein n=1 Tax=Bifidobacterium vansinderenii TaxID=1984871 RepID=A0A229VY47_9BIFI|nr:DNA-binding protein [Bifidobacterium vansinderenii]
MDGASPSVMLGMLAGVAVDDGGADDLLEQRSARDRPRLALEPRHATIIILILVLALSLSLTLLVQQGVRLSSMSWDEGATRASDAPSASPPASSSSPGPTSSESSSAPSDTGSPNEPSATPSPTPTTTSTLIDLNTATAEQLQTIKGIGPVTAQRIIDHRAEIGRYTSVDQLLDVTGIGAKTLEKIRPYVEVRS